MVDFRRVITALAVFALFVGLASAQVIGGSGQAQLVCATNVTVTPQLRNEGLTEQTGDIVISCTGGSPLTTVGATIPLVNFTISYNSTVTSRLFSTGPNVSEALLLVDEPGAVGVGGDGPARAQKLCTTPTTGCNAFVAVTSPAGAAPFMAAGADGTYSPNVYQGLVSSNQVTFQGVPVFPPGTTSARVYRITNVRVNANVFSGASAQVVAGISVSGATSLPISQANVTVGFVNPGLSASASAGSLNQCSSSTKSSVSTLSYTENFGTAFKTRVFAQSASSYAGQVNPATGGNPPQNVPGGIYNSESNFVFPVGTNQYAGLADFGTRLKATFNGVPSGMRIFVSVSNVNNNAFPISGPSGGGTIGGNAGNVTPASGAYVPYAQLINGESTPDGGSSAGGFVPVITASDNGPGTSGNVPIAEVSLSGGTGTAVWEVVNTNPNTNETLKFAVYVTAPQGVKDGAYNVNMSYAPTSTTATAVTGNSIPRFVDNSTAQKFLTVNICRTILLYPYITHQGGFDTGLAIANTSMDPFTTGSNATVGQTGSCTLNWYGGTTATPTTPPNPSNTGPIGPGTVWINTVGAIAPSFQGYMFAICNFQYAHGFAFISDLGARNLAMGYLALVIQDPGSAARVAAPGSCLQGGTTAPNCLSGGEQDAH